MVLIKNRQVEQRDPWQQVPDDDAVPAEGDVIVGARRVLEGEVTSEGRNGRVGLLVNPEDELDVLAPALSQASLVAIAFPRYGDGRGYSKARLLREKHAFAGELRAVGEVLTDQLFFMARCGFDAFELVEGKDVDAALAAFDDFSVRYQGATDEPKPLYRRAARGA